MCNQGEETPIHLIHECDLLHMESVSHFGISYNEPRRRIFLLNWGAKHQRLFHKDDELPNPLAPPAFHTMSDSEEDEE